jgi:murein DD-endopeptidase MepM/ murein hydrolase activator NlpD
MNKKLISILAGIMAAIMLLSLMLGLLLSTVHAAGQSSSEIEEQIKELEKEYDAQKDALKALEDQLAENNKEIRNMVERKNGLDQQIVVLSSQIVTINQIVSAYNLQIADKQDELDAAQQKLTLLQEAYKDRIRAMEEQGAISYWSVIFQASSFSDLLDRLNMIAEIAQSDRIRMQQIRDLAQKVEDSKLELDMEKQALEAAKVKLQQTQGELEVKNAEAEGLLFALLAAGDEYQMLIDEGEKAASDLMDQLEDAEDALEEAKYKEWLATSIPPTTTSTRVKGQLTNEVGGIVWYTPTTNFVVTSKFGYRYDPINGKWSGHDGVDLAAPKNTPIVATRSGVVTFTGYQDNGAGYYVWVNHGDGFKSIYMHMTRYIVKQGQYVEAGEIIGYVGSTGRSTGNHLHFGLKYEKTWVDPLKYIKVK